MSNKSLIKKILSVFVSSDQLHKFHLPLLVAFLMAGTFLHPSCKKYLEKKPDAKLAIPTSLTDFQALMNNPLIIEASTPGVPDLGTDDYYISYTTYMSLASRIRNCYTWAPDIWEGASTLDWNNPYKIIDYCNVVLEGLEDFKVISSADQDLKNSIIGHALFVRATEHFFLEETFGQPFTPSSANSSLGIPLKLTANLSNIAVRSTVQNVYNQILSDLKEAKNLLPAVASTKSRPTKLSAFAMLARVYLVMQDYANAKISADSVLVNNNSLQNFNLPPLGTSAAQPTNLNPFPSSPTDFGEILYPCIQYGYGMLGQSSTNIDSSLFNSYDTNDLRKVIFFIKNPAPNTSYFKGFYSGSSGRPFSGPAMDEVYLIRAEAYARLGNKALALSDLNTLLSMRWKTGTFNNVTAVDAEDALRKILLERRKELIFRGLRWIDLRRLNQDTRFAITLTRVLNGQTYTLLPNDPKYTYPIPLDEIRLSGIPQNPR